MIVVYLVGIFLALVDCGFALADSNYFGAVVCLWVAVAFVEKSTEPHCPMCAEIE